MFLWWPGKNGLFGWEILVHLPYSKDIATLDYHFFFFLQSLENLLQEKQVLGGWNYKIS